MESIYKQVAIFIPTRGRFQQKLRKTIQNFHLEKLSQNNFRFQNLNLIVQKQEVKEWKDTAINIEAVNNDFRIENVRQHILKHYQQYKYHIVIDDDLKLRKRGGKESAEIKKLSANDVINFFDHIISLVTKYAHGGIANERNHPKDIGLSFNERVGGFHFYNSHVLKECNFSYCDCPEHEDMHATLSVLAHGYPNVISNYYAFKQITNSVGGCSIYRTLTTQNKNAKILHKMHPKYVKMKKKHSDTWNGKKISVIVSWKNRFYDFHKNHNIVTCDDPLLVHGVVLKFMTDVLKQITRKKNTNKKRKRKNATNIRNQQHSQQNSKKKKRRKKQEKKKTIIKVKYNGLWCVAKGTKRIEETGETIVDWGKGMSTIYEEKDYEVKIENV